MVLLTLILFGAPFTAWISSIVSAVFLRHRAPKFSFLFIALLCTPILVMFAETFFNSNTLALQMLRQPEALWTYVIRLIWLGMLIMALMLGRGLDRVTWFAWGAVIGFVIWQLVSFTILLPPSAFD